MSLPEPLGGQYRAELHAGAGCCCGLNSWRKDVKERDTSEANRSPINLQPEIPPMMQMFLTALSREFVSGDTLVLTCSTWKEELIKSGRTKKEAEALFKLALHYIAEQRHRTIKDFMG
jgi:hypothetical protein